MATSAADVLKELQRLNKEQPLRITELSDSLRPQSGQDGEKRSSAVSDASADVEESATPASLEAELVHYKDLFSKLRFSYVEQVTKEKFLRAITDNPPLFVEPQENEELEAQLVEAKAALKMQKVEVAELLGALERQASTLSQRCEAVEQQTTRLAELPGRIGELAAAVSELRALQEPPTTNPSLSLPLPETQALLSTREAELAALNSQVAGLQAGLPPKTRELDRLEKELQPLEMQKAGTVAAAKEARRRREQGEPGMGDELEDRGKWLKATQAGLTGMLEPGAGDGRDGAEA